MYLSRAFSIILSLHTFLTNASSTTTSSSFPPAWNNVSNKVSSTHSYITNDRINEYNLLLQELAEEKQVYYIDTENAVASEDGSLPADAAADGIHLVKGYCEKWLDYLKTHSIAS